MKTNIATVAHILIHEVQISAQKSSVGIQANAEIRRRRPAGTRYFIRGEPGQEDNLTTERTENTEGMQGVDGAVRLDSTRRDGKLCRSRPALHFRALPPLPWTIVFHVVPEFATAFGEDQYVGTEGHEGNEE